MHSNGHPYPTMSSASASLHNAVQPSSTEGLYINTSTQHPSMSIPPHSYGGQYTVGDMDYYGYANHDLGQQPMLVQENLYYSSEYSSAPHFQKPAAPFSAPMTHMSSVRGNYLPVSHPSFLGYPSAYGSPMLKTGMNAKRKREPTQTVVSCTACKAAHRACRGGRPCLRCIKYKIGDSCRDAVQKKRGPAQKSAEEKAASAARRKERALLKRRAEKEAHAKLQKEKLQRLKDIDSKISASSEGLQKSASYDASSLQAVTSSVASEMASKDSMPSFAFPLNGNSSYQTISSAPQRHQSIGSIRELQSKDRSLSSPVFSPLTPLPENSQENSNLKGFEYAPSQDSPNNTSTPQSQSQSAIGENYFQFPTINNNS
eukprot:Nk52_evm57s152 gene=Nk52_evmTU57s152